MSEKMREEIAKIVLKHGGVGPNGIPGVVERNAPIWQTSCAIADEVLALLSSVTLSGEGRGKLHGPFGHLIVDPDLSEEYWELSDDPANTYGVISIPLYATEDPFAYIKAPPTGEPEPLGALTASNASEVTQNPTPEAEG